MTLKWLKQAEADPQAAWDSYRARHYEWSCFQAQQSGEKALKGIQMAFLGNSPQANSTRRRMRRSA